MRNPVQFIRNILATDAQIEMMKKQAELEGARKAMEDISRNVDSLTDVVNKTIANTSASIHECEEANLRFTTSLKSRHQRHMDHIDRIYHVRCQECQKKTDKTRERLQEMQEQLEVKIRQVNEIYRVLYKHALGIRDEHGHVMQATGRISAAVNELFVIGESIKNLASESSHLLGTKTVEATNAPKRVGIPGIADSSEPELVPE